MNFDLAEGSLIRSDHIFSDLQLPFLNYLINQNHAIGRVCDGSSLKLGIEHHIDTIFMLSVFFNDNVSFLEADELGSFNGLRDVFNLEKFLNFALLDNVGDNIPSNDILDAVSQARFDILATHGNDFDVGAGKQRVGPDSTFHQDRIFPKTVPGFKLMILFLDFDCPFLDDVERVGIIPLVKDNLPLFVSLGQAATCQCIFLVLSQVLKEGKNL